MGRCRPACRQGDEWAFSALQNPAISSASHQNKAGLQADRGFVIAPVREAFDLSARVRVLPINDVSAVWEALGY